MALVCPQCHDGTLTVLASLELPSDSRSDEIRLQVVRCTSCGFEGLAVYEESGRGALGSESVDHRAYWFGPEVADAVRRKLAQCPNPTNRRCGCAVHRAFGERDARGRWIGLQRYDLGPRMPIGYRSD